MFYILFLVIKEKKMKIKELNEKQRLEVIRLHRLHCHQDKSSRQIAKKFKGR